MPVLTITPDAGTYSYTLIPQTPGNVYQQGDIVTVAAYPASGYRFDRYRVNIPITLYPSRQTAYPYVFQPSFRFVMPARDVSLNIEMVTQTEKHVYIGSGSSFQKYDVYIGDGSSWVQYDPYIGNGDQWKPMQD